MQPFVKWAGGKTQLLGEIVKRMPEKFDRYFEPFVGGGALFLELKTEQTTINDINKELINVYTVVKNNIEELIVMLQEIDGNHQEPFSEYYYSQRRKYNEKILKGIYDVEMAALFIYLNKHCFNGLYRVNSNGLFNVPFNGKKSGKSFSECNLRGISEYLGSVSILNVDFEKAVEKAKKGDFIFFDSPYAPLNDASFESYTKDGFTFDNHLRLAKLYAKLTNDGVYCLLTNHNTVLIRELYAEYKIDVVPVKRMINSDAKKRIGEEVIITNY